MEKTGRQVAVIIDEYDAPLLDVLHSQFTLDAMRKVMCKRLGITVFQPRLKVCTFARTNYYEYGKQRQVQESP